MDQYLTRLPVFNKKMNVCGYHLVMGDSTREMLLSAAGTARAETADAADPEPYEVPIRVKSFGELTDRTMPIFTFSDDLIDGNSRLLNEGLPKISAAVYFGKNESVNRDNCAALKSLGYKTIVRCAHIIENPALAELADMIQVDFPVVSASAQYALIRQYKRKSVFFAGRIESWQDFRKAADMGYELFQGYFYLRPIDDGRPAEIRSLNASLISVLGELESPQPNIRRISSLIEHDLGLSYRLLRLVNSAYMAPIHKISNISQAIIYLGTRELHQWISMLMLYDIKTEENSELIRMSLIRGKLMAMVALKLRLPPQYGSNPFFTGLFSLIDVILNKDMNDLLAELPFTDEVKNALRGKNNELRRLLGFVTDYEQGRFHKLEGRYPMDQLKPGDMVSYYIDALRWSSSGA